MSVSQLKDPIETVKFIPIFARPDPTDEPIEIGCVETVRAAQLKRGDLAQYPGIPNSEFLEVVDIATLADRAFVLLRWGCGDRICHFTWHGLISHIFIRQWVPPEFEEF